MATTAEELKKQREKIEKRISELQKIIKDNQSLRGSSLTADNYLNRLEKELAAETRKLRKITSVQGSGTITPIQDVTVESTEVKDPNEPNKGRQIVYTGEGIVAQTDPTVTLKSGEERTATQTSGLMLGMPSTGDAKDVGAYIIKDEGQYLQEIYNVYSKDAAKTIETKRRLIEAGQLDANEPLDGNVSQAFRDAVLKVARFVSEENYFMNQSGQKRPLLSPEQGIDLLIARGGGEGGAVTTTSVTVMNRESAQQILDQTYLNSIGRKATKKEVDEFYRKVQKEAKARPNTRTATATSSIAEEGFSELSAQEMASAQAEARPDFLAYQLSTNFYDALYNASRLPVQLGSAPTLGSQ